MENTIIVTRHPGLVEVLTDLSFVPEGTPVIAHATAADVRGKHVVGVLPLALAAEAASITEITLDLPLEARGKELSAAEIKKYMAGLTRYVVTRA
jgi:putative CRISPR-associated protein (TIGR02620 family)